jgi:hypothetical protein
MARTNDKGVHERDEQIENLLWIYTSATEAPPST